MTEYRSLTFILGGPRSGTTWLAKIFDSHPDVLYRHEPDLVRIHDDVPHICPEGQEAQFIGVTRAHFRALMDLRTVKTVGSRPLLAKSYEPTPTRLGRAALINGLRGLRAMGAARHADRIPVPEFIAPHQRAGLHMVIKSVVSLGRAGLLAEAFPEARFVLILRNPFGQIASRLQGEAQGKLGRRPRDEELPALRRAREFGLTADTLASCSEAEYLAWEWAILTQKAIDELEGRANVRIVRHSDLVADPIAQAKELIAFAGLDWREEIASFIASSADPDGAERYFDVKRDPRTVVHRWRSLLSAEQQTAITRTVMRTPLPARWPEFFQATAMTLVAL